MESKLVNQKLREIDHSLMQIPNSTFGNLTLLLFFATINIFSASIVAYLLEYLPLQASAAINLLCLYALYTVNHEAVHRLVHPNRTVNNWVGRIAAVLEGTTFPLFRILHPQHHAFTNHPEYDPDYVIGRKPRWLLPLWTLVRLTHDNSFMINRRLWSNKRPQLIEHLITVGLQLSVVIGAAWIGHLQDALWLWVIPLLVAGALIELTVAWAVHFPQESQHPLENTRIFKGQLLQILMLNQNYHIVHHLWPSIPWFRYGKAISLVEVALLEHQNQTPKVPIKPHIQVS